MTEVLKRMILLVVLAGSIAVGADSITSESSLSIKDEKLPAVEVAGSLTAVYQRNVKGGLSTHSRQGEFSGSYDIEVNIDTEQFLGLDGDFFIYGRGGWTDSEGIDQSSVGSYFGTNADAEGNRSFDVIEAFYHVNLSDNVELNIGKIDFTGFFDASEYANDETMQFLNGSLVNNSAVPFSDYCLGIIVDFSLADNLNITAGVADAQGDGRETGFSTAFNGDKYYFYIAEARFDSNLASFNGDMHGAYRLGVWNDPQPKANSDRTATTRDDVGFYASFDQMLVKENAIATDDQGFGVFFRYGYADSKRNDLNDFCSLGCQYKGLFDGRDADVLGLGYSYGNFSNGASNTHRYGHECATEMYYNIEVNDNLCICPDLQYIKNPGGTNSDAVLLAMRLQYSF